MALTESNEDKQCNVSIYIYICLQKGIMNTTKTTCDFSLLKEQNYNLLMTICIFVGLYMSNNCTLFCKLPFVSMLVYLKHQTAYIHCEPNFSASQQTQYRAYKEAEMPVHDYAAVYVFQTN